MEEVIPGLSASAPEPLPFAPAFEIRSFLLRREAGNLLVCGAGVSPAGAREAKAMGGVSRHYLNHRQEAAFVDDHLVRALGAPLFCHEDERREVSERLKVTATFSEQPGQDLRGLLARLAAKVTSTPAGNCSTTIASGDRCAILPIS